MQLYTHYIHEKRWVATSASEALRMIEEEMPETDAEATLRYIVSELEKGKRVTLGTCQFATESVVRGALQHH